MQFVAHRYKTWVSQQVHGHAERELKALKHHKIKQVNLSMGEGALGKHIGLPHSEESLEGSTKLLLAAPSCRWCACTHPVGNVLRDALAVKWTKLLRFAWSSVTPRSVKQNLLPCSRLVWCRDSG